MATIHDVMPAFELFQPASVDDTLSLLERHRKSVWVLAGGLDTFDWLKDRNKRPQVVIDLSGINATVGIEEGGIRASLDIRINPSISDSDSLEVDFSLRARLLVISQNGRREPGNIFAAIALTKDVESIAAKLGIFGEQD